MKPKRNETNHKLLLISILLLSLAYSCTNEKKMSTTNGTIDLSTIDSIGIIEISGDVEFYREKFYSYQDFQNKNLKPDTITTFPDVWNRITINGEKIPPFGYATYRLKIITPPEQKQISFYVPHQGTAYKFFVNDKLLLQSGTISTDEKNASPDRRNRKATITIDTNVNELIFQISNYDFRSGGLWYPITIAQNNDIIEKHYTTLLFSDIFLSGFFTLLFIISIVLSLVQKRNISPLLFGLFNLFILIRHIITNTQILEYFFPDKLTYSIAIKIEYLSIAGIFLSFLFFFLNLLPKTTINRKTINWIFVLVNIIFIAITLFTNIYIASSALKIYQIFVILAFIYATAIVIKAIKMKSQPAKYILVGFVIIFISTMLDMMISNNLINLSTYFSSYAFTIFAILQLTALGTQIVQIEKNNTSLRENLETISQLNAIGLQIISNLEFKDVFKAINSKLNKLINFDFLSISVMENKNTLRLIGVDKNKNIIKEDNIVIKNNITEYICVQDSNSSSSEFSDKYKKFINKIDFFKHTKKYQSLICRPLRIKNKIIGTISVMNKNKNSFSEINNKTLESLSLFASVAFENANIYKKIYNNEQELKAILSTATEGIGISDKLGYFTYANNSLCKMSGYSQQELTNFNILSLFSNDNTINKSKINDFINEKTDTISANNQFTRKNKSKVWAKLSLKTVKDHNNKTKQIVGIFTNINELKQSELKAKTANAQITASINYAKKIQKAMMPSSEALQNVLPNHFLLFKPRDIVSGDFYYTKKTNDKIILAVGDCTGHGVPGAMLSMLGISLLNDVFGKINNLSPATILDKLRENTITALRQEKDNKAINDGLDIALAILNTKNNELNFAGAYSPMLIYRKKKIIEIKGDKMPISKHIVEKPFKNNSFQTNKNDVIYLFSDGYQSQLNDKKREKLSSVKFKTKLTEIGNTPLHQQKTKLTEYLEQWRGTTKQTDDIIVIGFKI